MLDEQIEQLLPPVPRTAPVCTACGVAGGGHAPGCQDLGVLLLGLADRLDEITGIGAVNARATDRRARHRPVPVPHPRARRRLGPADPAHPCSPARVREARPHRQGQPVPARRARPGRDDRGQDRHPARRHVPADRPQARQAESHRRGRPRHLRDRLDPHLRPRRPLHRTRPRTTTSPRSARPADQGPASARSRQLNPGKKVILITTDRRRASGTAASTARLTVTPPSPVTYRECHATRRNLGRSPAPPQPSYRG